MTRPTYLTIDLAALRHNLACARALAPHRAMIAMVKANAYGHGLIEVAQALDTADAFGVATLEEGVLLREAGIQQPVILFNGFFETKELVLAAQFDLTLVVHHEGLLQQLEQTPLTRPVAVWIKINTGMNRLGFDGRHLMSIHQRLFALPVVRKPIGLMTHFAEADNLASTMTSHQIERFHQATAALAGPRSLSNSAALLAQYAVQEDWVRPGLMLYGISPFADKIGADFNLKPVMTAWSRIISILPVKKGGRVGYGGTWVAPMDSLIGVVSIGYGDGYTRALHNGTPVLVNGKRTCLVGRVCMDLLTVDLTHLPETKIGDAVMLWGEGLPIEQVAAANHTFAYEMITSMNTRRPHIAYSSSRITA